MEGDELVALLSALASPHRLRVLAALSGRRSYVSELAREVGISRPLLQVHLRKLEAAGLVSSALEVGPEGKALHFYEARPLDVHLTPAHLIAAARSLSDNHSSTGAPAPRNGTQDD